MRSLIEACMTKSSSLSGQVAQTAHLVPFCEGFVFITAYELTARIDGLQESRDWEGSRASGHAPKTCEQLDRITRFAFLLQDPSAPTYTHAASGFYSCCLLEH